MNLLFLSLYRRKTWKVCAPEGAAGGRFWFDFQCLFWVGFFLSDTGEFLINPKLKRGRKGRLYKQMFKCLPYSLSQICAGSFVN